MRRDFSLLRTIDFSEIGLGDNLMAWSGLYALLINGIIPTAPGCVLYVPAGLAGLADGLFAPFEMQIEGITPGVRYRLTRPVFTASPPDTFQHWWGTYIGADWRMNCFEALDAQKFDRKEEKSAKIKSVVRLQLSEWILYRREGWRAAAPEYVGYRMWRPLARAMGILPLPFLALMKNSLPILRRNVSRLVDSLFDNNEPIPKFAIFPSGKSFQAFPPSTCQQIQTLLPEGEATFFLAHDDPWIDGYRDAGIRMRTLRSLEELVVVIQKAPSILTTDSFSSHIAQFLRDDFVLSLTRDFQENVVHPGARPFIFVNHPPCAPCSYITRDASLTCSAKHSYCIAFNERDYIVGMIESLLS